MSKNYKLQLYAFECETSLWDNQLIYKLYLPKEWKGFMNQFGNGWKLDFKTTPLGKKLQSIFPQIIWVNNKVHQEENQKPWLIAIEPLSIEMILLLAKGWMMQVADKIGVTMPAEVDEGKVGWQEESVKAALLQDRGLAYSVLPALVAHQFCKETKRLQLPDREEPVSLEFSLVSGNKSAECMSQLIDNRFSYVVRVHLEYRAGELERHLLMVSAGIRRFVMEPPERKYLKGKINSTILVSMDNPFMRRTGTGGRSYSSLSFRRVGGTDPYTKWSEGFDELYFDVLWGKTFSTEEILKDPAAYAFSHSPKVWVVHSNRMFGSLWIEAGISIEEKMRFYEMVREQLALWKPLPLLDYVVNPTHKRMKKGEKKEQPVTWFGNGQDIVLEVWGSDQLYHSVARALKDKKYNGKAVVSYVAEGEFRLNAPSANRIRVVQRDRQDFLDGLDYQTYGSLAEKHRVNHMERSIEPVGGEGWITLALVEILPKKSWGKGEDPKQAARQGFQLTGRLSQFIHPEDKEKRSKRKKDAPPGSSYIHKVFNSILDLLGDSGVVDGKGYDLVKEGRPILAFDLVRGEAGLYAIQSKLENGSLFIKGKGQEEWQPLRDAVLNCHKYEVLPSKAEARKKEVSRWVVDEIRAERLRGNEVVVLLEAEMRIEGLVGIQNRNIEFGQNPPLSPWIQEDPGVTIVRVNANEDVPSYGFEPLAYATGVYSDGVTDLYYGVGLKPKTQKGTAKAQTKYTYHNKPFQQPRLLEYMPLGDMDREDRDSLAWMTHSLRELCITYESTTAKPYPLKMMGTLKKYLKGDLFDGVDAELEEF